MKMYCSIKDDSVLLYTPASAIMVRDKWGDWVHTDDRVWHHTNPYDLGEYWREDSIRMHGYFTRALSIFDGKLRNQIASLALLGYPAGGQHKELPVQGIAWFHEDGILQHYCGTSQIEIIEHPDWSQHFRNYERLHLSRQWNRLLEARNVNDFFRLGGNHVDLQLWITQGCIELTGPQAWYEVFDRDLLDDWVQDGHRFYSTDWFNVPAHRMQSEVVYGWGR